MSFEDIERGDKSLRTGYQSYGNDSDFVRLNQVVYNNVKQLAANVGHLSKIVPLVGTSQDTKQLRDKIREVIDGTKDLAKDTSRDLKSLSQLEGNSPGEKNSRRRIQSKLTEDFQKNLGQFQELTRLSVQRERDYPVPKGSTSTKQSSSFFGGYGSDNRGSEPETERLMETNLKKQKYVAVEQERLFNEMLIEERDQGIREIETTIVEVNEIFKDLAKLVEDQGSLIENIETNIVTSAEKTSQGVTELREASAYQKSARTKMCCVIILILIIAAVIVTVVALGVKLL